jgi:DNA polymerase-3 subunit beta
MNLTIDRTAFFNALKAVIGVVERKNTNPILSNVLLSIQGKDLTITASNLEMEVRIVLADSVNASEDFAVTLPARKVYDLLSTLPEGAAVQFDIDGGNALMKVGRSRYKLSTLPAENFPIIDVSGQNASVTVAQSLLNTMIKQVDFAMATQDVRYYLNGMLFELEGAQLTLVATDGHRLAKASTTLEQMQETKSQLIVPRRTVIELAKALGDAGEVSLGVAHNHLMLTLDNISMVVKLIEGKFPEYQRVIPVNMNFMLAVDKAQLTAALARVAILANDKLRGVRVTITPDSVELTTSNPEQDEADEFIEASFNGDGMTTGFNLRYLQEVMAVIPTENALFALKEGNSPCLTEYTLDSDTIRVSQVIMPMRL